jgi:hypothetical protein
MGSEAMRRLGLIVAIVVATVDVVYLWYIGFVQSGASELPWRVPFVASYLGVVAVCAILSAMVLARTWQMTLLGASAGGLVVLGFFALFSIGLPLFVMGLLVVATLVRAITNGSRRGASAVVASAGALTAVVVLLTGFEITGRIIACPPGVVSGGGGAGFLTGPYSYTCQNGRAIVTYGP